MPKNEILIIAEMANAHEGDPENAKAIVSAAAKSGASAIKFQVFKAAELAAPSYQHFDLYKKLEMPEKTWADLVNLSHGMGLLVYCDIFGIGSAELMASTGADGFMIHAADASNVSLLNWAGASDQPVILSTGGSTWIEVAEAIQILKTANAQSISLMYGFQNYPTPIASSYLHRIGLLREKFGLPVGFACHLSGDDPMAIMLPSWAVASGADIVEVHITMDRSKKGLDYFSSLEPSQFTEMVRLIRSCEPALGPGSIKLSEEEARYRLGHRKCLVSTRDIKAWEMYSPENIGLRRINNPPIVNQICMDQAIGHKSVKDVPAFSPIILKDVLMKTAVTLACRAESTRLYGKPMQLVGDRPILQHLIDRLRQVKSINEIVLAISDGPSSGLFIDYAKKQGLSYVLGPEKDVLKRLLMAADHVDADIVVRTTTENPYVYWENVDNLLEYHIHQNVDLTVTEKLPIGAAIEIISLDALKKSHAFGEDRHRSELCTLFISENPDIFNIQRISAPAKLQRPDIRLTVDTPYDLIFVRTLWQALHRDNHLITVEEIIDYIHDHPEVDSINKTGEQTLYLWK